MKMSKILLKKFEKMGFKVEEDAVGPNDDLAYNFIKSTPAGMEYMVTIETGESYHRFALNAYDQYADYDPSYEAYICLDNTGHGRNGAPYDMRDVYEDMLCCEQYLLDIYRTLVAYEDTLAKRRQQRYARLRKAAM